MTYEQILRQFLFCKKKQTWLIYIKNFFTYRSQEGPESFATVKSIAFSDRSVIKGVIQKTLTGGVREVKLNTKADNLHLIINFKFNFTTI